MFLRRFTPLALLCLVAVAPAARAEDKKSDSPSLVIRVQSIDSLLDNFKYLAGLAGREEEAKQVEGLIKSVAGDKGLEGIDTKSPFGIYGSVGADGFDSSAVGMIPVADETAFLDLLERVNVKPEKD